MQSCVDTLNTTPYSAVHFTRGTYADGVMLQEKVFKRFRDSDMYLASAIDANSMDVSSIYEELEHLKAASDVIAVYGTFSAFSAQSGDLGYLSDKDIIKVLNDATQSANQTYYQYNVNTSAWNFMCSLEPYYSITESNAHFKHIQTASAFIASSNNQAIIALTQTDNGNVSAKFGTVAPNVNLTAIGTAGTATSATSSYLAVQSAEDAQTNTKTFNLTFDPSESLTSWYKVRGSSYETHLAHAVITDLASEGGASYGTLSYPTTSADAFSARYMLLPYINDSTQGATWVPVYTAPGTIVWRDDYQYAHVMHDSTTSSAWRVTFKKVDVLPDTLEDDVYYLI